MCLLRTLSYSQQYTVHCGYSVTVNPNSGIAYLGQGGSWDLHKFEEFFWRSRVGGSRLRMSLKVHRISSMNTWRKCVCPLQIVYAYLASAYTGNCSWAPLGDFRPPEPLCPPYLQTLATPLNPKSPNRLASIMDSIGVAWQATHSYYG